MFVDKHCSDVCCDEFLVPQIDCKSKQVKEQRHGRIYLHSIWGKLAILNTENTKICEWITKQFVCIFPYLLNICRKFEFLIFQGSVATCLRWDGWCCVGFVANFMRFPEVQKFWKSVKAWQSFREFKGGNFFEILVDMSQCVQTAGKGQQQMNTMQIKSTPVAQRNGSSYVESQTY